MKIGDPVPKDERDEHQNEQDEPVVLEKPVFEFTQVHMVGPKVSQ
jgi:hypothetical protein